MYNVLKLKFKNVLKKMGFLTLPLEIQIKCLDYAQNRSGVYHTDLHYITLHILAEIFYGKETVEDIKNRLSKCLEAKDQLKYVRLHTLPLYSLQVSFAVKELIRLNSVPPGNGQPHDMVLTNGNSFKKIINDTSLVQFIKNGCFGLRDYVVHTQVFSFNENIAIDFAKLNRDRRLEGFIHELNLRYRDQIDTKSNWFRSFENEIYKYKSYFIGIGKLRENYMLYEKISEEFYGTCTVKLFRDNIEAKTTWFLTKEIIKTMKEEFRITFSNDNFIEEWCDAKLKGLLKLGFPIYHCAEPETLLSDIQFYRRGLHPKNSLVKSYVEFVSVPIDIYDTDSFDMSYIDKPIPEILSYLSNHGLPENIDKTLKRIEDYIYYDEHFVDMESYVSKFKPLFHDI